MIEENEEVKNVVNEETDTVEETYDIVLEGTLNYKIFIKDC